MKPGIIFLIAIAGATPATRPSVQQQIEQADEQISLIQSHVADLKTNADSRKAQVIQEFDASEAGVAFERDVSDAKGKVELAKSDGSPQDRIDALGACNNAADKLRKAESAQVKADPEYQSFLDQEVTENQQLASAQEQLRHLSSQHWRLKPGAPPAIKKWFDAQLQLRITVAEKGINAPDDSTAKAIQDQMEDLQHQIDELRQEVIPQVVTAHNLFGGPEYGPNEAAESERQHRISDLQSKLGADKVALKKALEGVSKIKAAEGQKYQDTAHNQMLLVVPELRLAVGEYGSLGDVQIVQIVDTNNMLVRIGEDELVWLEGIDTSGLVDDHDFTLTTNLQITGTKQYNTAMGATKTVFVAQPCDHRRWVELVSGPEDSDTPDN